MAKRWSKTWSVALAAVSLVAALTVRAPAARALNLPGVVGVEATATAFQGDALHDGDQPNEVLTGATPTAAWKHAFTGSVSYPLIVGGTVYVSVTGPLNTGAEDQQGIWALNAATGDPEWGPAAGGGNTYITGLTYDQGRVFVLDSSGVLIALDANSGRELWLQEEPDQYSFSAPPTARNGIVYVSGAGVGGDVYANDETTGRVLWTQPVENGDESSPTVSPTGVYVSYACSQTYDFTPTNGSPVWHHDAGCEGGGGETSPLHNGILYDRNTGVGFNAASGTTESTFDSTAMPAFDGDLRFELTNSTLRAVQISTGRVLWSQTGDGTLDTHPFVVGGRVYVGGTSGELLSFDEQTGAQTWSTNVGSGLYGTEYNAMAQGLGAGDNLLVAPASTTLVAFGGFTTTSAPTGGAVFHGSTGNERLAAPVVGMAVDPATGGYWLVASDGGVFSFDAPFYGSEGATRLPAPIVGMAATPSGGGYDLVGADGSVYAFGDAGLHGSAGSQHLAKPVVGMAIDPATGGYWLATSDGGVLAFDAPDFGSQAGTHLNGPIVGIAPYGYGDGYYLDAADGGVFSHGAAPFHGSAGDIRLTKPVVGMTTAPGGGYWLVAADGGIFSYGAPFAGSAGNIRLTKPVVGAAASPDGLGYWLVASDGGIFSY